MENIMSYRTPDSSVGKESACYAGHPGWISGSGRSAGARIGYPLQYSWASLVAQLVKNCLQCRRPGFDPWVGKIPWRRERLPLQYSDLENSMDCTVHGVTKNRTWLREFHFTLLTHYELRQWVQEWKGELDNCFGGKVSRTDVNLSKKSMHALSHIHRLQPARLLSP